MARSVNFVAMGLEEKFGRAVKQFAEGLERVFNVDPVQRVTFDQRNSEGASLYTYSYTSDLKLKTVYPILVVQDFSLNLGYANRHLKEMFDAEIKKRLVVPGLIRPLSLITIEDLETVIPYIRIIPLENVLENYVNQSTPIYTFENVFARYLKNQKIAHRTNEWIGGRLKEILQSIKETFHTRD
jgi:hypothetical protein